MVVGADAAVHELLRVGRDRRHGRRAAARHRPARAAARVRGRRRRSARMSVRQRQLVARLVLAARGLRRCSRSCRSSNVSIPKLFDQPISSSPGTLALLAACLVFGGARAHLRHPVRVHRPALVRSRALHRGRRVPLEHRDHRVALELLAGASSSRSASAFVALGRPRLRQPARRAGSRSRWSRSRSRRRARCSRSRTRTTGRTARRGSAPTTRSSRRRSSASSTRRTSTGSRSRSSPSSSSSCAGAVESSPGRVWQAIRENEQRVEVLGHAAARVQAAGVRPLVDARRGGRHRLHAALQRLDARRHRSRTSR